jgi:hypothetical protein
MAALAIEVAPDAKPKESGMTDRHQKIEELAYQLWLERGCPIGSDQDDWYRAENMLKSPSEVAGEEFVVSP